MAMRVETNPLEAAYAVLLSQGLDGAGEALRILVNEASKIERARHLNAQPHERCDERQGYTNGFKPKTVMTRMGELPFAVPQVRDSSCVSAPWEKPPTSFSMPVMSGCAPQGRSSIVRCWWRSG